MSSYLQRAEKVFTRIGQLAAISEDEGAVTRTFGTKAFLEGSSKVAAWMKEAGLQTRIDQIGNVRGKLLSKIPGAKTFVIASHIDTVVNAGKFDGPLGVIMGLDLMEHVIAAKLDSPFNIELIAFSDEEGVRYHTTFLGSKVITGAFDKALLDKTDRNGITLKEAINTMGGDDTLLAVDAILPENWLGYYEIHIEQGPVLWENKIPVALVTAIAGQKRVEVTYTGFAGHAGTVPMDMRNDALTCAAEFVLAAEQFATQNKYHLVATVGKLEVIGSASNVIPGQVVFSLDLRSPDEEKLNKAYEYLKATSDAIAAKRGITSKWNLIQETPPTACDLGLSNMIKRAIVDSGFELVELGSGAGHDAVPVSEVAPVSMLFVRCYKGISHNPLENAELADVAAAIRVSDNFINQLIQQYK
jgi:allantoate deiminase